MTEHTFIVEKDGKKLISKYTDDLKNDLKKVHNIDVEAELEKILLEQIDIELKKLKEK
jgi:Major capsid protein Gp23